MYGALWRALPGGRVAKAALSLLLALVFVAVCFFWLFPLVTPYLPINDVTVEAPTSTVTTP